MAAAHHLSRRKSECTCTYRVGDKRNALFALHDWIAPVSVGGVSVHEIAEAVVGLSATDRLELARRIVDTVIIEQQSAGEVARAVQGIEDVLTGKVRGLSEAEFQRSLE